MVDRKESSNRRRAGRPRTPVPRETLIAAAVDAFADQGYSAASLDRIAEEGGIRKSSLLHRFGNKESLYLESLTAVLGKIGGMVEAAATGEQSFPERLDELSALITNYLFNQPRAARLLFREVMDRGPVFSGPGSAVFDQVLGAATAFIQGGVAAGEFQVEDAADTVMSIVGIHLTYFAVQELSEQVRGEPIFTAEALDRRRREVTVQVRRICGAS